MSSNAETWAEIVCFALVFFIIIGGIYLSRTLDGGDE